MFRDVLGAALERTGGGSSRGYYLRPASCLICARQAGAIALDEEYPRGLNNAVRIGTNLLIERGATDSLHPSIGLPIDSTPKISTPCLTLCRNGDEAQCWCHRDDFSGTNMIVRSPANAIGTYFGRLSLARHLEACREARIALPAAAAQPSRAGSRLAGRLDRICTHAFADPYLQPALAPRYDSRLTCPLNDGLVSFIERIGAYVIDTVTDRRPFSIFFLTRPCFYSVMPPYKPRLLIRQLEDYRR